MVRGYRVLWVCVIWRLGTRLPDWQRSWWWDNGSDWDEGRAEVCRWPGGENVEASRWSVQRCAATQDSLREGDRRRASTSLLGLGGGRLGAALEGLALLLGLARTCTLVREIGAHEAVPPAERGGVAADERLVVVVVVVGARPEGDPVVHRDGEVVARVRVDRLEEAQHDPDVHGEDVQVLGEGAQHERSADGAHAENQHLERMRILGRQTEGRRVLVVLLVDVLVQRAPMQRAVRPVVEGILKQEEEPDLPCDLGPVREGHLVRRQAKVLADGVERPDLRQLYGKVRQQHVLGALPLLLRGGYLVVLQLVLAHARHGVDDDPRDRTAKVDELVQHKRHDARRQHRVAPVQVPVRPCLFEDVERRQIRVLVQVRRQMRGGRVEQRPDGRVELLRNKLHRSEELPTMLGARRIARSIEPTTEARGGRQGNTQSERAAATHARTASATSSLCGSEIADARGVTLEAEHLISCLSLSLSPSLLGLSRSRFTANLAFLGGSLAETRAALPPDTARRVRHLACTGKSPDSCLAPFLPPTLQITASQASDASAEIRRAPHPDPLF
ncbi:hypothetical protein L1887_61422 [Cichorium endivia]|nr:hypothetical protein L1887_61422 [Cichorium endivia]